TIRHVDRHIDRAEPVDGEPDTDHLDAVRQPDRHRIALLDAKRCEASGGTFHHRPELGISDRGSVVASDEGAFRTQGSPPFQDVAQNAFLARRNAAVCVTRNRICHWRFLPSVLLSPGSDDRLSHARALLRAIAVFSAWSFGRTA